MAITATFLADYSQFVTGTQQAEGSLVKLQAGAGKIPPAMQQITTASGSTATSLGSFQQGLAAVDRTLASVGIQIGPQVRALQELAAASGKTATQLGMVATAGLTVAAAMGGWQLGRMVADWFDLDESIANATARLLGFGDVAAQTAGAKMDVLARASKIAGVEITNFGQALAIIKTANDEFSASMNTSAHRVSLWQGEIRKLRADGVLDNLQKDLEAGHSTLKELSAEYGISSRALEYFSDKNKVAGAAVKEHAAETKKLKDEVEQLEIAWKKANAAAIAKTESEIRNAEGMERMNLDIATQDRALLNNEGIWLMNRDAATMATAARDIEVQAQLASEASLQASQGEGLLIVGEYANANKAAGDAATAATGQAVQGYAAVAQQVSMSAGVITEWIALQQRSMAANAIYAENKLFTSRSQLERVSQLPIGGGGGGGTTNVNVNVSGVFDANAKRQLTEAVSSGLTRSVLQGSKVS